MKTHLPVALRKALLAAIFAVSAFAYNKASAETESPSVGGTTALEVTVTGNNETYSHTGDINVTPMDSAAGYDALKITAGDKENGVSGSITVESAPTTLYNSSFNAEGDITIGEEGNKYQKLDIRGSESTVIEAAGDIYFNHRVDAAVGQGSATGDGQIGSGSLRIHADGNIEFNSHTSADAEKPHIRLAGGSTDKDLAELSAGGSIKVTDHGSCTLVWSRHSNVTAGKDITITLPYSDGLFSGAVNAGTTFSFVGANFSIYDVKDTAPTLTAGEGISVATTRNNYGYNAKMTATKGDITLVSSSTSSISNRYFSVTAIAESGNISVQSENGRAYMEDCVVESQTGKISVTGNKVEIDETSYKAKEQLTLSGTSLTGLSDVKAEADSIKVGSQTSDTNITSKSELENVHTSLTATENIDVEGSRVNISDATTIQSNGGSVRIGAFGDYMEDPTTHRPFGSVNIRESAVEAKGDIGITGSVVSLTDASAVSGGENTIRGSLETSIAGTVVKGGSLAIGTSTGTTSLGSSTDAGAVTAHTTLDATGKIAVTGKTVSIVDVSVDSTGTDADGVSVAITGKDVEVSGENVTGTGSVTIAGTASTEVNGVDVDGASIAVGCETSTTTITNTVDKSTTLDATGKIAVTGTTVSLTDISVDSTGTDADGVSVAINGKDVEVSGKNVTGTGSVTIAGTTSTAVNGVDVDGASIAVGSETGATTITNTNDKPTTLDATGKIAVTGTTVSLTDISVDSTGTDADGVSVAITGKDVEVSGENVTGVGAVNIVGTTSSTLENVVVSGQTASITGDEVSVTGESVTGTDSVTIAGTTSTTIENVDVKESATATIGSDTATGQTSLNNSSVVVEGEVAIAGGSVNITGNEGISSETGSVKITATAGTASIASGAVTAEVGAVAVSGASQTTLDNVVVDGNTVSLGNVDSVTTITGGTIDGKGDVSVYGTELTVKDGVSIDSQDGKVTVSGATTEITAGNVTSQTGDVEIIGSTTNTLSGVSVGGKEVSVTGGGVSVTDGTVAGTEAVAIAGSTSTEVNGVDVDGASISVGNETGTTTITNTDDKDTTLDATGKIAVTGTTVSLTDISVDSTGTDANGVSVAITGSDVEVSGENVTGTGSVTIAGSTSTEVNGVDVDGKTVTVGDADSATTITGGTIDGKGDVSVYGTELTVKDAASIDSQDGKVTVSGATTEITGGNVTSAAGDVDIIGSTTNTLSGVSVGGKEVSVTGGAVSVTGGTVAGSEAVTIAGSTSTKVNGVDVDGKTVEVGAANSGTSIDGGTIDGAAGVEVNGATVSVNNNAAITAKDGDVSLNSETVNHVSRGTSITAESGGVEIALTSATGGANIVTGAIVENDIIVSTAPVSITAGDGALVMDGGVSGDNLIDYATMTAAGTAGSITIKGKTNAIGAAVTLQAATGITVSSLGTDTPSGNKVDASTLSSTDGDIVLNANYANHVSNGTVINAESGGVKIALTSDTGYANIVTGAIRDGAVVTDTNPVSITAGDGAIEINGGDTGENLVEYATLTAAGTDGSITIQGKANGVGADATLQAAKDVSITASGEDSTDGNYIDSSTINAAAGKVDIAAENRNVLDEGKVTAQLDVNISADGVDAADGNFIEASTIESVGGAVNILAANYTQIDKSSLSAHTGVAITSTGTAADDGNEIDYSTIETETGDVTMTANGVNFVEGSQLTAEAGQVALQGGSNVLEKDTQLQASKGVSVISTGTGIQDGNLISASTLQTSNNDVKIAAEGINLLNATKATTDNGSVLLTGSSNVVQNSSAVQATTGITVTADGEDAGSGNQIAASTLTSTDGDITVDANYVNYVTDGAEINAKSGGVKIELTSDNGLGNVVTGATAAAPNPVSITAGDGALMIDGGDSGENLVEYATLTAGGKDGIITIQGKANGVGAGANLLADKGVNIISTGTDTDASDSSFDGNLIYDSSITAKEGNVSVAGESINRVIDADIAATTGAVNVTGHMNLVQAESTIQAAGDISVVSTGEEAGSANYVDGSKLESSAGSIEIRAEHSNVVHNGSTVHANQDIDIISTGTGDNRGNVIQSSTLKSDAGDVKITAANINQVEASGITASAGALELNGDSNLIYNGATVQAATGVSMTSSGIDTKDGNQVSDSTVTTSDGDVVMTSNQFNAVINADIRTGYMEGKGDIIIGDEGGSTETVTNGIVATEGHNTSIIAGRDVRIAGSNVIMGSNFGAVTIAAAQGDITLRDDNDITCAVIDAAGTDGDVAITTGTGDKGTTITNSGLYGQTVTIAGDTTNRSDDNLAVVTGENTRIASRADAGVGLTLNNVFVRDTENGNTNIFVKTQSDIAILNRVDLQNGTLTIKQGASSDGRIVVDAGNVLNARAASSLEGRLTGAGDINKSGGDSLLLDYDHSEFTGSIYANGAVGGGNGSLVDDSAANAGSWIEISGEGVGAEASIVLKNTDLVISTDKTRIGTLDTTQDSDVNEKGTGETLLTDGSYTADGNERTDFTTVGSVLEVNKGKAGDVVQASDMKLSDATLIKLDAEVNGAEVKADTINAAGIINAAAVTGLNSTSTAAAPSTARVYIRHADLAAASNAAEGARTTIMTGTMATDINEDVLYDVTLSDNGTYQRTLQDRNVHLENKGDHVDLVYSKNYRSAAKDANLNQVADALKELSDSFHHTEGTLASSSDTMKRLVDAFDYTRSEEAALRGLRSVAGTGNVLPRLMQFDSSRRHLSALRQQMEMPVCKYAWKGALNRTNNVWMSYTGAYDNLSGDSNMGDYSRNAYGAIVGVDRSLSCKLRVGLSLGYETSTGKADDSKVDADTFFVDAYATGVTGQLKHRASVGLAASSFEYDRNVLVEAGYHTFNGLVKGETDGLTLNFGYELSSDYHFSERSRMNRYLAVNLAWHQLDSGKEDGLGAVGLTTEFEDEWQADLALGVNYIREFAALRNQKLASFYANAAVHLELLNDRVTATNRLGDSGAGWQTSSMERSPLYFELGAGVVVPLSPTWTGTAGATFEIGPDRYGFSGGVGARYSF